MSAGDQDDQKEAFAGFSVPNHTPTPDEFFDIALARINNLAEIKVIAYTIRRTFGWKKRQDRISISQYVEGIRRKDGTVLDNGTGLARSSVVIGLEKAVQDGYLEKHLYCRNCNSEVRKSETIERRFKNQKTAGVSTISAVAKKCPVCQAPLEGQINVYYSLKIKPTQLNTEKPVPNQSEIRTGGSPEVGLGPVRDSDSQETLIQDTRFNVNVEQVKKGRIGIENEDDGFDPDTYLLIEYIDYTEDKNPQSRGSFMKVIKGLGRIKAQEALTITKDAVRSGRTTKRKSAGYLIGVASNMAEEMGIDFGFKNGAKKRQMAVANLETQKAQIGNRGTVQNYKTGRDDDE